MRQMRARRRAAGLKVAVSWVPADSPATQEPAGVYSSHRLQDARSLAMHVMIARKVDRDPRLLDVARRNLARWRRKTPAQQRPRWMQTWSELLRRPWPEIAARITAISEEGAQLRQSTPFAGVLTPAERRRIHDAFRA
ncbi:MAG: hypothetical protein MUF07_04990 [Steroidobacteraceae bacterium]|jgi:acyl-CoA reductase-like NAD-dependent aldehyde dehydrogenase|nr:hypothetical protein [Steroidobacteraceae bacterium]